MDDTASSTDSFSGQSDLWRFLSRMGSNCGKTPHVCFKAEFSPETTAADDLPRLLERNLYTRFGSIRVIKSSFLASLIVVLQNGQKSYSMVLGRSKFADDEWLLLVSPSDAPGLLNRLCRRKPLIDTSELMLICREIHALLAAIPNISAVRWYFRGQTTAVATPDELF